MKNLIKITGAFLLLITFAQKSNAQFKVSAGLDVGFALEKGYGLMYGVSVGGEYELQDNMGITAQVGYIMNTLDLGGFNNASSSFIPFQLGYKYYFESNESGAYALGQIGMHVYNLSYEYETFDFDPITFQFVPRTEKVSNSDTYLSYAVGGGYLINENIDLGLRFNIISATGGSFNYLALRAAYNF
jgi:hypothetical protein